jgi:hypothetical protein
MPLEMGTREEAGEEACPKRMTRWTEAGEDGGEDGGEAGPTRMM